MRFGISAGLGWARLIAKRSTLINQLPITFSRSWTTHRVTDGLFNSILSHSAHIYLYMLVDAWILVESYGSQVAHMAFLGNHWMVVFILDMSSLRPCQGSSSGPEFLLPPRQTCCPLAHAQVIADSNRAGHAYPFRTLQPVRP